MVKHVNQYTTGHPFTHNDVAVQLMSHYATETPYPAYYDVTTS